MARQANNRQQRVVGVWPSYMHVHAATTIMAYTGRWEGACLPEMDSPHPLLSHMSPKSAQLSSMHRKSAHGHFLLPSSPLFLFLFLLERNVFMGKAKMLFGQVSSCRGVLKARTS